MARALNALQAERAARSHIVPVTLIKLTTYTNLDAEDVDKIFYLSNVTAEYDFGNTGVDQMFLPVVSGGGDFFAGMSHLSQPNDLTSTSRELDVRFSNLKINGQAFITLLQEHNLEGARIQIAELYITPDEMDGLSKGLVDLKSYVGDEHYTLFRGRLDRIAPIESFGFTMLCREDLPSMAKEWVYAADPMRVFQRDVGARLPRIYGKAVHTRLVTWDVGLQGTMVDAINVSETTNKLVTDGSIVPKGERTTKGEAVFFLIDDEVLEMKGVEGTGQNTFDIIARGAKNTTAAAHLAGAIFQVIRGSAQATWIVSDQESAAVPTLYSISNVTGLLTRLDPTLFAFTLLLADKTAVPGRVVTSINLIGQEEFSQQPNSLTGGFANQEENAIDRLGKGTGADATYNSLIAGATAAATFQNLGVIATQTIIVDLTAATQNVEVLVGAVVIGTVSSGDIPAAGTNPARFEFTTTETGNAASVRAVSSGNVRLHNIERRATITGKILVSLHQIGSSQNSNITLCTGSKLIDENTGTFCDFTLGDNEFVEVTFSTPPFSFATQRVHFIAKMSPDPSYAFDVNGVEHHRHAVTHLPVSIRSYQFQTDKAGNTLKAETFTSEDLGTFYEIERDVEVIEDAPPPGGFGDGIYADVNGVLSPGTPVDEWAEGEDFDDGTWNVAGAGASVAAESVDKIEGIGSQKITIAEPAEIFQTETTTNWTGTNATVAVVTDEDHLLGSGAIEGTPTNLTGDTFLNFSQTALNIDISDTGGGVATFVFDFKIKKALAGGPIQFRFGSDAGNVYLFDFDYVDFEEDIWVTVILDKADADRQNGTPVDTDIDYFSVLWNHWDEDLLSKVYVDNIRIYRDNQVIIQNNAVGGNDFTAPSQGFRIGLRADGNSLVKQAVPIVYISDDVGTGTTLTPDWRQITFPKNMMPSWDRIEEEEILDQGTIVITNIRTVRFECTIAKKMTPTREINPRFTLGHEIVVDDLQISDTLGNAYKAGVGSVMTHPADIIRHWVEEVGGELLEAAGYDALFTSLGAAAEWGFDARGLGFTWPEVLQRMAFEARCNVIAVETPTGRAWRILVADKDYGWGNAVDQIGQVQEIVDEGRGVDDLANSFTFGYAFDASLGDGSSDTAYKSSIVATPDKSDVPITAALIDAAARRAGLISADPRTLLAMQDDATALDVAGYIVQENMDNRRRVYRIPGVAWFDALPREVGDLVRIVPTWRNLGAELQLFSLDSQAGTFTAVGSIISDEAVVFTEGVGSLEILNDNAATISHAQSPEFAAENLLGRALALQLFVPTGDLALLTEVGIRVSSTAGGATDYLEFSIPIAELVENAWQRLEFRIDKAGASATNGSPDLRKIVNLRARFTTITPDTTTLIYVDDIRVVNRSSNCRITSMTKAFTEATWDLVAIEVPAFGTRSDT